MRACAPAWRCASRASHGRRADCSGADTRHWQVAGLKGTGSCDFSVTELFVPEAFTWELGRTPPQRGGPLYNLGLPGFVANEHAAFALGVGQRALDTICALVQVKQRGYGRVSALQPAQRCSDSWGRPRCGLGPCGGSYTISSRRRGPRSVRGKSRHHSSRQPCAVWHVCHGGRCRHRHPGVSHWRWHGTLPGEALQRCLRDINAAAQHLMVSDMAYKTMGSSSWASRMRDPMG